MPFVKITAAFIFRVHSIITNNHIMADNRGSEKMEEQIMDMARIFTFFSNDVCFSNNLLCFFPEYF